MKALVNIRASITMLAVFSAGPAIAEGTPPQVLFTDVHVFDGVNEQRIENANVLVEGNLIKEVSTDPIEGDGATVIDGGGRTLMPGLIDMHWHSLFATVPQATLFQVDFAYMNLVAARANEDALMRGFTTVRDVGGNVFGLKKATDEGLINGPRIYPSGAYLSQTSGHGDFRGPNDVPEQPGAPLDYFGQTGISLIADGRTGADQTHARNPAHGRLADQGDGGRRCLVALRPARYDPVHDR
jgi:imidazolonepropionase-like amidohydrolase